MSDQISEAKMSELAGLIASGRKIEAIKLYRELTGLGLAEAKYAIESLEASSGASQKAEGSINSPLPKDKLAEISECLFRGNKIEAIRLYREFTKVGLRDAKEQIDALEASLRAKSPQRFVGTPASKGCFGAATVICLCGLIAVYWLSRS